MKKNEVRNNKGFSLVELIVVIAIMAVLVGVLAPLFIRYVDKSRQSTDLSNLDSIMTTVEAYYADKDNPPASVTVVLGTAVNTGDANLDAELATAGVVTNGNLEKRSNNWTTDPGCTYNPQTGEKTYQGTSNYYDCTADTSKPPKAI